jgi:hypothetical protein
MSVKSDNQDFQDERPVGSKSSRRRLLVLILPFVLLNALVRILFVFPE